MVWVVPSMVVVVVPSMVGRYLASCGWYLAWWRWYLAWWEWHLVLLLAVRKALLASVDGS